MEMNVMKITKLNQVQDLQDEDERGVRDQHN